MKKNSFYDLFDEVRDLKSALKADAVLTTAKEKYGVEHILYARLESPVCTHESCFIQGTYTDEWLRHYFDNDYLMIDPVNRLGLTEIQPFDWRDIKKESKLVRQIFDESIEFGLGKQGLTIPMENLRGERALLNINADMTDREWNALKPQILREMHIVGHFLHHTSSKQIDVMTKTNSFKLSNREVECLKWAASGKSVWETSVIISMSERAVRYHLDQARRKLQCTTKMQTVAKAVALEIINIS